MTTTADDVLELLAELVEAQKRQKEDASKKPSDAFKKPSDAFK
jgi:hypothetical protein